MVVCNGLSSKVTIRNDSAAKFRDTMPSRNACRNLFGPVDHKELREEIEKDRRKQLDAKKRQYNFDFEKEEPLSGRYVWQLSRTIEKSSSYRSELCQELLTPTDEPLVLKTKTTCYTTVKNDERPNTMAGKGEVKEHKITDFFRFKKRKREEPSLHGAEKEDRQSTRPPEKLQQLQRSEGKMAEHIKHDL